MGYVLSILMNALRTWLLTKLWDSFFTRRFNGKQFWAYWRILAVMDCHYHSRSKCVAKRL